MEAAWQARRRPNPVPARQQRLAGQPPEIEVVSADPTDAPPLSTPDPAPQAVVMSLGHAPRARPTPVPGAPSFRPPGPTWPIWSATIRHKRQHAMQQTAGYLRTAI